MRRVVTLLSVRRAARCYPGRGRGSAAADVLAPDQGVALLELALGSRAARVIEQHDVHALASQESRGRLRTSRRRIARRFRSFEDLILRFATRPDLDIFSNNEAERTIRPVKVQQRGSGGCWRTLTGLADFALIESYLSTAAKWGISKLDALRDLFNGNAWMPPGLEPAG
jgi:hypothetical protein